MNIFSSISKFLKKIFTKNFEVSLINEVQLPTTNKEEFENKILEIDNKTFLPLSTTSTTTTTLKSKIKVEKSTIKHLFDWEAKHKKAYNDGVGIMTIGIGHAIFNSKEMFNGKLLLNSELSDEEIYNLLYKDIYERTKAPQQIESKIKISLNQNQFDALTLFIFNTGTLWNVLSSYINENYGKYNNIDELKTQWRKYNTAKGKVMAGLINRREGEIDLFLNEYKGRNYYTKAVTKKDKLINPYY